MSETLGDFGEDNIEKRSDENLVEFYLRMRKGQLGVKTRTNFDTAWNRLQDYMEANHSNKTVFDLSIDEVKEWYSFLKSDGVAETTVEKYAVHVSRMMDDLRSKNHIKGTKTPFNDAFDVTEFNTDTGSELEVSFSELKDAINDITSPFEIVIITLLAKYGLRVGELVNIDERDLNIDHPISTYIDSPRQEIRNKRNVLYIDSSITEGEVYNGEFRRTSSKQHSTRTLPLDDETVALLAWYLSIRSAPRSPAKPILIGGGGGGKLRENSKYNPDHVRGLGSRSSTMIIQNAVEDFAKRNDWYVPERRKGIYPHWFRHWFTTVMRNRIDDDEVNIGTVKELVQGLRGDTGKGVIETYTQEWGDAFEEETSSYEEVVRQNLPTFFD